MLTLIRREIRDHIIYFIAAVVFSAILIALLTAATYNSDWDGSAVYVGLSVPLLVILVLGFSAMGVTQMYMDRNRRISAFLSALPVTRSRILWARIVTGLLAILIVLVPLAITAIVMGRLTGPPIPISSGYIDDILATVFLMTFACYCLGLLTGWTANKIAPTFGALGLNLVLVSLVFVKGFGPDIKFLLVLVIVACLIRTWHKFMSTSL
jgi:ABC-type transport system involved in multi-copper enzyme maturation permease subunit